MGNQMARIRTIKPEFFTSEDIVSLCPMARLLYIALWCEADREGRMQWKPRTFKIRYFPADDCDIESLCSALTSRNLVKLYGDGLANIPQFQRHQHINPRESQSLLPVPDASGTRGSRVSTRASTVSDAQVGKERKGRSNDASDASGFDAFWKAYPKKFAATSTEVYGVGAFLLAGSEVYRLVGIEKVKPQAEKESSQIRPES